MEGNECGETVSKNINDNAVLMWDECEMVESEVKYYLKHPDEFKEIHDYLFEEPDKDNKFLGSDGTLDEDELSDYFFSDDDFFTINKDMLLDQLSELMEQVSKRNCYSGYWVAGVENFGWRNLSGVAYFKAETGSELLEKVLPKTDCTFYIFKDGQTKLKIRNYHHDSPMGNEWYCIRPATKKEVESGDFF